MRGFLGLARTFSTGLLVLFRGLTMGKVLLWNQIKSRMEACYSELILDQKLLSFNSFPAGSGDWFKDEKSSNK